MLKKIIVTALIIFVAFLLQTTLFQSSFFGLSSPNLLLIVTFIFGFMGGKRTGMVTGLVCGLLIDVYFCEVFGFNALLYMTIGYANGFFNKIFFEEDVTLPLLLVVGSDLFYNITFYIFRFMLRNRLNFFYYFIHVILPELIFTVLITVFVYWLALKLNRRLREEEKRSANKFV